MTAPTPPASSSSAGRRAPLGIPLWGWAVAVAAAVGGYVFIRLRNANKNAAAGTSTTQGVTDVTVPSDQQIGLTQYEQISSELVGIQGTQEALLAAIKDLQGDESDDDRDRDKDDDDRDRDHDCPRGHHWDAKEKRCVKDVRRDSDRDDVKVPNVFGESWAAASAKIRRAGLEPERTRPFAGPVLAERPAAGRTVERGSKVTVRGGPRRSAGK